MNKAFVRESDAPPPRCPERAGCGQPGLPVTPSTLAARLSAADAARFTSEAWYCPNPACPVGYYDAWGGFIGVDRLGTVSWPKDPAGCVCSCLEIPAAAIVEEVRRGRKDLVMRIIAHARGAAAACSTRAPDGRSCEREVRRLFQNPPPRDDEA